MLSVCIPVYQYPIEPLVRALLAQLEGQPYAWEVRCLDDGSGAGIREQNRAVASLPGVVYEELSQNRGRSACRNALAERAKHEYLLFLDCDGMPGTADFISGYLALASPHRVVVGKRVHDGNQPQQKELYLRWLYGTKREERPAGERNRQPYEAFCSFHFLCPREVYLGIRLDESLRQYGHEDTLFGLELERRSIPVWHADIPYFHLGLEPSGVFLEKTRQGLDNIAYLCGAYPHFRTRLSQTYFRMKKYGLRRMLENLFRLARPALEKNLLGPSPSLFLFDLYKLGYLACVLK